MEFQRSLGREVLEYKKEGISAKVVKHDLSFGGLGTFGKGYLYIPHGPEMDFNQMTGGFKNPVANFVKWLHEEGKKRKSIFVKAEPLADSVAQALAEHGFKKSKKEVQPSKTVLIDLRQSEDELLGRMHHKTRYNIGIADKHGVVVGEGAGSGAFLKLIKKTAKRDRFSLHPDDYYKKLLSNSGLQVRLYFAKKGDNSFDKAQGKQIAAAIVLIHGDTCYYLHGASDYEYRSLMAPYALHWHIIKQLKVEGLKQYDLWGIDSRKWPGVTRFKLGWGGRTVELPGAFNLPVSRSWFLIYRLSRKLTGRSA